MKNKLHLTSLLTAAIAVSMFYGCSKSNQVSPEQQPLNSTGDGKHVYGLLPTPVEDYEKVPKYSEESFRAKFHDFATTPAPAVLTLATPAVRDQGQIGSCTGFCGAEAYEIMYRYKNGSFPVTLSPLFVYYEERVNINGGSITSDPGANMVNIGQVFDKYGVSTEALYAYPAATAYPTSTAYRTPPSSAAISAALSYKASSYTSISSGDTAAVKNCLRHNIPVMMGLNIYDNTRTYKYFEGLNTTSYTYNPLTSSGALASGVKLLGGHATPIVGYDDTKKAFLVQNSWSASWGLNGFYYMPYSVFMSTKIVPQGSLYYATI